MGRFSVWLQAILTACILCHGVLGKICTTTDEYFSITKLEDVELLRDCDEVEGDIKIGPEVFGNIDLSGPKIVHGNITAIGIEGIGGIEGIRSINITISSSTLTTVDGSFLVAGQLKFAPAVNNISLPRLNTVGNTFSISGLPTLTYLDVTDLHTFAHFELSTPRLSTLKHTEVRNVTGKRASNGIFIAETNLESMDSLFNNNISINSVSVYSSIGLKRVTVGFNNVGSLMVSNSGNDDGLEIVLGGQDTVSMQLGYITLTHGCVALKRSDQLQTLTVNSFVSYYNNWTHLHLPFDQLSIFRAFNEQTLKWISIPPQAMQWADFSLYINGNPNLNLSSEYMIGENGELVRSWYWPQNDMKMISISGGLVTNAFFDSFLEYHNATVSNVKKPKVVDSFRLYPNTSSNVDCKPFEMLATDGILHDFGCYVNVEDSSAYSWREKSLFATTLAAAVVVGTIVCNTA
ncbi:hypothetical protein EsH8_V_000388 [Colletotrichum jinshuiense]